MKEPYDDIVPRLPSRIRACVCYFCYFFDPPFDFPRESPNFCLLLLANIGGNTCLGLSRDPENVRHH